MDEFDVDHSIMLAPPTLISPAGSMPGHSATPFFPRASWATSRADTGRSPERGGVRAVIGAPDLGSSFSGSGFFDGGLENKAITWSDWT